METVTVGFWIDAGSRVENQKNNGMAHFFEHMAFKGSKLRRQHELSVEVENMGAQLNAYTSREQTVFYCRALREQLPVAVEMLSDIIQNPLINERDVEDERGVILREVQEIDNMMDEVTFDYLHAVAFQGTPLAQTILGPEENIRSLKREELRSFVQSHYRAPHIVLAAAGGVDHEDLVKLASKHWGQDCPLAGGDRPTAQQAPCQFTGAELRLPNKEMQLAHVVLAVEGCSWSDPDFFALKVASSLLGEWNRSQATGSRSVSQLADKLSATNGGCHSFMSVLTCYSDTGLLGTYFVAEPSALEQTVDLILDEWRRLCMHVTDEEVRRVALLDKARFFSSLDGSTAVCEEIGRQMLVYNRRMPPLELDMRLDAVNADWVRDACARRILNRKPALVAIGPTDSLPSHQAIVDKLKV